MINLIQRIKGLKKMGVTVSSHIDYRIYDGLSMRGEKKEIESGERIVEGRTLERYKKIQGFSGGQKSI